MPHYSIRAMHFDPATREWSLAEIGVEHSKKAAEAKAEAHSRTGRAAWVYLLTLKSEHWAK